MPCHDGRVDNGPAIAKKRIDHLTRMLCEACKIVSDYEHIADMSNELCDWWSNHKMIDELRENIKEEKEKLKNVRAEFHKREPIKTPNHRASF